MNCLHPCRCCPKKFWVAVVSSTDAGSSVYDSRAEAELAFRLAAEWPKSSYVELRVQYATGRSVVLDHTNK